jgi:hypothetical protein
MDVSKEKFNERKKEEEFIKKRAFGFSENPA